MDVTEINEQYIFTLYNSNSKISSITQGIQDNSTDLCFSNDDIQEESISNINQLPSETILDQMKQSDDDQSMITIQEEHQTFNKKFQSIDSLDQIQQTSKITIQEEEDLTSSNTYFQNCQKQLKNDQLKNNNNKFTKKITQEKYNQNNQNTQQINQVHFSKIIDNSQEKNKLQQFNNNQIQINILYEAKYLTQLNKMISPCRNNTILNQSPPLFNFNTSQPKSISPFCSSQQIITHPNNENYNNGLKQQLLKLADQNDSLSNSTYSPLSKSNYSNECITSDDQECGSSFTDETLLKTKQDTDIINQKNEQCYKNNSFDEGENTIFNQHQSTQVKQNGDNIPNQNVLDDKFHEIKCNFVRIITDTSQEYWNQLTEEDDQDLLYLYNKIDKNNVNKNILSSFLRYILEKGDDIVVECLDKKQKELNTIRKELKNFTRCKKLNNNTLNSFFNSKRYSEQFQYYLKFYAIDYFQKSKVKDKSNHFICTAFFLRCFFNNTLRENMVVYNKSKYFKSVNKKRLIPQQQEKLIQTPQLN